jgi:Kelch motif
MRRILVIASALLLTLVGCRDEMPLPTAPAGDQPSANAAASGTWLSRADYPRDSWYAASASITDPSTLRTTVYVIGGKPVLGGGVGPITDAVRAYDVSANVWRSKARYPVRVEHTNGAVEINGRIYVSGGWTREWDEQRGIWRHAALQSLYVYDPGADQWTRRRDMPVPTVGGLSVVHQGLLYVITPCSQVPNCGPGLPAQGVLWRYNPATDRWVLLAYTPHDTWMVAGGFIGGKLYLVGREGATDIYDPFTGHWSTGPEAPAAGCGQPSVTLQARLYILGCRGYDPTTLVFDPSKGSWTEAAAPPRSAGTLSRIYVSGRPALELVGGNRPGNNWQFIP